MATNNMYSHSVYQWNPFVGCKFDCIYCKNSFQAQLKRWAKQNCRKCYNFEPHEHPERLEQRLPPTKYMQFIFTCPMGDISFCSTEYLRKIVNRICQEPDKTFLIQSKDPITFARMSWPNNVILGTTIETESDLIYEDEKISQAIRPTRRFADFYAIKHQTKMITFEPIIDFDLNTLCHWAEQINPSIVWLGYNTKNNKLPEPPIEKVRELHWQLSKMGILVMLKKLKP